VTASPLVDAHVHLYPDAVSVSAAKESYEIWEYGADPGVEFATGGGDLADLSATYRSGGFDRVVVVHLLDTASARREAVTRLAPDPSGGGRGDRNGATSPGAPGDADLVARVEACDQIGVADAVVTSNRWVLEAAAAEPLVEVLIGVDPTVVSRDGLAADVGALVDTGARGVKLHPVAHGYLPGDRRLDGVYATCAEAGVVVVSHSGAGHASAASARPREFAPVLHRWPTLRLVLAHLGGAAWHETAAFAADFPQVTFDLSGRRARRARRRCPG
jgi:hypothetical protein